MTLFQSITPTSPPPYKKTDSRLVVKVKVKFRDETKTLKNECETSITLLKRFKTKFLESVNKRIQILMLGLKELSTHTMACHHCNVL